MSLEVLNKAIDEEFDQLKAAFQLDTGEESPFLDERADSREFLVIEGTDHHHIATKKNQEVNLAVETRSNDKFGITFIKSNTFILGMISIMVLILSTWTVKRLLTLDVTFPSGNRGTHQSSTYNIPVF